MGTHEIKRPKNKDPQISPNKKVVRVIGLARTLSIVLAFVSQGVTIGAIELAVKSRIIANNPETTYIGWMTLFIENARKSTIGNKTPAIITGPLL